MKIKKYFLMALISIIFASCSPSIYYQVYETSSSSNLEKTLNSYKYEDTNCIVNYNLWGEGGNFSFFIYNKTNENLYLNKRDCFFIHNGIAYNYYNNRVTQDTYKVGKTVTSGVVVGGILLSEGNNTGVSRSFSTKEDEIVCIPPKTSRIICEFTNIYNRIDKNCGFDENGEVKSIEFNEKDTPLKFGNLLSYSVGSLNTKIQFENNFYISKVSNYSGIEYLEDKDIQSYPKYEFNFYYNDNSKQSYPNKFYVVYDDNADED